MATRIIKAPTGNHLNCKNWQIEAPYRMIQNNLDPDVAENPNELVVYGGKGKAARNWECYDSKLSTLNTILASPSLETSKEAVLHSRLANNTSLNKSALKDKFFSKSQELHSTGILTLFVFVAE